MPDIRYWCNTCKKVIEPIEVEGHPHELAEWGGQGQIVRREKVFRKKKEPQPKTKIPMLPPNQMEHIFTAIENGWRDEMKKLRESYEWSYPGLYLKGQSDSQKVSGGEQPDPTGNTAANRNRDRMRLAFESLAEIRQKIANVVQAVDEAGGQWTPTGAGVQVAMARAERLTPASRIKEARAAKARREERGQGWGTG